MGKALPEMQLIAYTMPGLLGDVVLANSCRWGWPDLYAILCVEAGRDTGRKTVNQGGKCLAPGCTKRARYRWTPGDWLVLGKCPVHGHLVASRDDIDDNEKE